MMTRTDFFDYVKENIKKCLPATYQEAVVNLSPIMKNNDVALCGLEIRRQKSEIIPRIYLDSFYERYCSGEMTKEQVLETVAKIQMENEEMDLGFDIEDLFSYEKVKDKLQIVLCDPEKNAERLNQVVYTKKGDFAATYCVDLCKNEYATKRTAVTPELLFRWGISLKQLHADALAADLMREPVLNDLCGIMGYLTTGAEPVNLLAQEEKRVQEELPQLPAVITGFPAVCSELPEDAVPMYCLTNSQKENGASLLLNKELMARVGEILENDFYVLPSSIHEVMIVPAIERVDPYYLQFIVQEVNATEVAAEEILSDKVEYYDRAGGVLENAVARLERLEEENAVEDGKAEGMGFDPAFGF